MGRIFGALAVWSHISAALAVSASPGAAEPEARVVMLPEELGTPRDFVSNCPMDAAFLRHVGSADRRLMRNVTAQDATGAMEHRSSDEPPDCRHEIAVKVLWTEIHRRDIEGMSVRQGVKYWAKLFRAPPGANKATVSYGVLQNLSLHVPGLHVVGGHRFEAEIHFVYKGTDGGLFDLSEDTPDITIVVPLAFDWAWDTPRSPVLDWVTRSEYYANPPVCDWSWQGIVNWFNHGLHCPTHQLLPEHLFRGSRRALHYLAENARGSVFVLSQALHINSRQIHDVKDHVAHTQLVGHAEQPAEVVVGSALQPFQAFSVFNSGEMLIRRLCFELVRFGSIGAIVAAFLLIKRFSVEYALEIVDFVSDPWVQFNLKVDHWFCYIATVVIPFLSYFDGSCNFKTGMPYEYQMCLHCAFSLHMGHEMLMIYQSGSTVRTLGYRHVASLALKSLLGLYHTYFHICFFMVAWMHSSNLFWFSLATFVLGDVVGQVMVLSIYAPNSLAFSARNFCVLHAVLDKRMQEMDAADMEESKVKQRLQTHQDESPWSDTSIEGSTKCASMMTEILQFVYQMTFVSIFGSSPIVTASVIISLIYLVSDMLARWTKIVMPH